tara:strand:- start:462 stop:635 length:174 start_codon:yes stop_codon:yes gene_type:complete
VDNIEKINELYKTEREDLKRVFKNGEINKKTYDDFLQQLDSAYNMDIIEAYLEQTGE